MNASISKFFIKKSEINVIKYFSTLNLNDYKYLFTLSDHNALIKYNNIGVGSIYKLCYVFFIKIFLCILPLFVDFTSYQNLKIFSSF